jgi:hypothetical protein
VDSSLTSPHENLIKKGHSSLQLSIIIHRFKSCVRLSLRPAHSVSLLEMIIDANSATRRTSRHDGRKNIAAPTRKLKWSSTMKSKPSLGRGNSTRTHTKLYFLTYSILGHITKIDFLNNLFVLVGSKVIATSVHEQQYLV